MLQKLYVTLTIILAGASLSLAQTGTLKGKVIDKATGETIPFANVAIQAGGSLIGATSDFNGEYTIKPIPPGRYTVKATYVGYVPIEVAGVAITSDKTTTVDLSMTQTAVNIQTVEVYDYKEPLIDPDMKSGGTVTREEFQQMATKNIASVAATTAGVYQADEGSSLNVRGSRGNEDRAGNPQGESSTDVYIDGERVRGSSNIPQQSVEQVTVITGGLPAQYGDATGGVINITTRGPQSEFFGGVELISSQLTDAFDYNFIGFSVGGPILAKKDTVTGTKTAKLGFIISGEAVTERDPDPSAIGFYKVKDEKLAELQRNPLRIAPNGIGTLRNSEFVTIADLEKVKARENVRSTGMRLNGKLDFKATKNLNLTLGGSIDHTRYHEYDYTYSLFNPENNAFHRDRTWRVFGRITQKFGDDESKDDKSASLISNAYYTLQAGYQKVYNIEEDDDHSSNIFNYGYIGKFESNKMKSYSPEFSDGQLYWKLSDHFADTLVTFTPDTTINPTTANYTIQYYNLFKDNPDGNYRNLAQISNGGGVINGQRPDPVYSTWHNTGRQYGGYNIDDREQFRVFTNFSADIAKRHEIQVGFEYEQRVDRYFSVAPIGLWTLMRQLTNAHIRQVDLTKPDTTGNVIDYPILVEEESQKTFDRNLRKKLGKADTDFIDIDSYAPETFSLDLFSAEDLYNGGNNPYVSYYGYDHTGKKLESNPSFDDFFTQKDNEGNFTRAIGAFRPIYMAGYIQDKFDFRDLKFNIGVRVDRFDANQKVLKDKYSLYETVKAGELDIENRPANIGDDYVVYVSDIRNPSADNIVGYRKDDKWYDSEGIPLTDPGKLATAAGGRIAPYIANEKDRQPNAIQTADFVPSSSFVDYEPQVNFMPRIGFSFPISDVANFFAHYDVLTQRPGRSLRMDPSDYYYFETTGGVLNNPDLKPERTTDYELGFAQTLSASSAITLSAFYREMRDMIQIVNVSYSYPRSYLTYGNMDFGTVKGFSVAYDLRRTRNVRFNVNYTLQFAEGTGSSATGGYDLARFGEPNLRTLQPLDFDARHAVVGNIDYRYASGKDYNGPVWFGAKVFSGMGANLTARTSSGVPYSRQSNILAIGQMGGNTRNALKGSVNGSRLPWNTRLDLRVDKAIALKHGKDADGTAKVSNLNIYLQVLNLLNTKNIMRVYQYTGDPQDDGYLTSPEAQNTINAQINPESFIDLYSIKVNDPSYYSIPRRIRLGVTLDF